MKVVVVFGLALWLSILLLVIIGEVITEHKLGKNLNFTLILITLVVILWSWFFHLTYFLN